MFNLGDLMGKMGNPQEMLRKMREAQEQLENIIVESESGGGMVRVTANGAKKVMKIHVDPDIIDKDDPEIMCDLITAAVNKALEQAEIKGKEEMQEATKGILPNIPGLDLGKLGL